MYTMKVEKQSPIQITRSGQSVHIIDSEKGIDYHCFDSGRGSNLVGTIVFIPGLGAAIASVVDGFSHLVSHGYRVIGLDMRDVGLTVMNESHKPTFGLQHTNALYDHHNHVSRAVKLISNVMSQNVEQLYSMHDLAHDIEFVVTQLLGEHAQFSIVGASMGSLVTQQYAMIFPHRLKSVTLFCSPCNSVDSGLETLPNLEILLSMIWYTFISLSADRERKPAFARTDEELATTFKLMRKSFNSTVTDEEILARITNSLEMTSERHRGPLYVRQLMAAVDGTDSLSLYYPKTIPTLILHGSNDTTMPIQNTKRLSELIPHAQVIILEGSNHTVSSDEFYDIIHRFINPWIQNEAN